MKLTVEEFHDYMEIVQVVSHVLFVEDFQGVSQDMFFLNLVVVHKTPLSFSAVLDFDIQVLMTFKITSSLLTKGR